MLYEAPALRVRGADFQIAQKVSDAAGAPKSHDYEPLAVAHGNVSRDGALRSKLEHRRGVVDLFAGIGRRLSEYPAFGRSVREDSAVR